MEITALKAVFLALEGEVLGIIVLWLLRLFSLPRGGVSAVFAESPGVTGGWALGGGDPGDRYPRCVEARFACGIAPFPIFSLARGCPRVSVNSAAFLNGNKELPLLLLN